MGTQVISPREKALSGIRFQPKRFAVTAFLGYSALWTLLEPVTALIGVDLAGGPVVYGVLIGISLAVAVGLGARTSEVSCRVRTTNTRLVVRFGDVFDENGIKAVPVNEFFDTRLGSRVSPRTVHGQLLQRVFGGHPEALEARLAEALPEGSEIETVEREGQPARRFPIGTTVDIEAGGQRFLLNALAHTDLDTDKAHATVDDLWTALSGLWRKAREVSNGEPVVVPLFGGGQSGVGLPPKYLLDILVLSLIAETKKAEVAPEVRVVLPASLFDAVDLARIKREWE